MVGWVRGGVRRGLLLAGCVVLLGLMQAPNGYTFQGTTSYNFVAWNDAMETLSLVLVALVLDLVVGIPLGIAAYRWRIVDQILRPFLDFLQTLPGVRLPDPGGGALRRRQRGRRQRLADLRAPGVGPRDDARAAGGAARRDRGGAGVRVDALAAAVQGRAADRAART